MIVDDDDRLVGIFTDSDLVRLLGKRSDDQLDRDIAACMTRHPQTIDDDRSTAEAASAMADRHLSELPVIDASRRPVGLVDVTDLIAIGATAADEDRGPTGPTRPPTLKIHPEPAPRRSVA